MTTHADRTARKQQDRLLDAALKVHQNTPALLDFAPVPRDVAWQPIDPHHIKAAELMCSDPGLTSTPDLSPLRDAFIDAAPMAAWRETYKDTDISGAFLDQFACYQLIGAGGFFACPTHSSYAVYMPAGLHYPWHHHPAEELYVLLAGSAEFQMKGHPPRTLTPGDAVFHPSNVPHATTTRDQPFMAYVVWRGDLKTKPVWSTP